MKILMLDIETSPNLVYTWGLFDQDVGLNQVVEPTRILCFAAKWYGKRRTEFWSEKWDGREAMIQRAHELLDEADVVMHYNGKRFDMPHLKREFLEMELAPPAPYQEIDLLTVVRQFKFHSHKLQAVTTKLGLEGKVGHEGFDLWRRCLANDARAWATMRKYNRQDVILLEELYDIVRPWIKNHPNHNLETGRPGCPRCGAGPESLQKRGTYTTAVSEFQRYQCQSCKGWSRDTKRTNATTRRAL